MTDAPMNREGLLALAVGLDEMAAKYGEHALREGCARISMALREQAALAAVPEQITAQGQDAGYSAEDVDVAASVLFGESGLKSATIVSMRKTLLAAMHTGAEPQEGRSDG